MAMTISSVQMGGGTARAHTATWSDPVAYRAWYTTQRQVEHEKILRRLPTLQDLRAFLKGLPWGKPYLRRSGKR